MKLYLFLELLLGHLLPEKINIFLHINYDNIIRNKSENHYFASNFLMIC